MTEDRTISIIKRTKTNNLHNHKDKYEYLTAYKEYN